MTIDYLIDQLRACSNVLILAGCIGGFRFIKNRKLPLDHWKYQETEFDDSWFYRLIGKTGQTIEYDFDMDKACMIANNSVLDTVIHQSTLDSRILVVAGGVGAIMLFGTSIIYVVSELLK